MTKNKIIFMIITLLILSVMAIMTKQLYSVSQAHNRVYENHINNWQNKNISNKNLYQKFKLECQKGIDKTKNIKEQIDHNRKNQESCKDNIDYKAIYELRKNIDYSKINIPFPLSIFISEL